MKFLSGIFLALLGITYGQVNDACFDSINPCQVPSDSANRPFSVYQGPAGAQDCLSTCKDLNNGGGIQITEGGSSSKKMCKTVVYQNGVCKLFWQSGIVSSSGSGSGSGNNVPFGPSRTNNQGALNSRFKRQYNNGGGNFGPSRYNNAGNGNNGNAFGPNRFNNGQGGAGGAQCYTWKDSCGTTGAGTGAGGSTTPSPGTNLIDKCFIKSPTGFDKDAKATSLYEPIPIITKEECAAHCLSNPKCKSINWWPDDTLVGKGECWLHSDTCATSGTNPAGSACKETDFVTELWEAKDPKPDGCSGITDPPIVKSAPTPQPPTR